MCGLSGGEPVQGCGDAAVRCCIDQGVDLVESRDDPFGSDHVDVAGLNGDGIAIDVAESVGERNCLGSANVAVVVGLTDQEAGTDCCVVPKHERGRSRPGDELSDPCAQRATTPQLDSLAREHRHRAVFIATVRHRFTGLVEPGPGQWFGRRPRVCSVDRLGIVNDGAGTAYGSEPVGEIGRELPADEVMESASGDSAIQCPNQYDQRRACWVAARYVDHVLDQAEPGKSQLFELGCEGTTG